MKAYTTESCSLIYVIPINNATYNIYIYIYNTDNNKRIIIIIIKNLYI